MDAHSLGLAGNVTEATATVASGAAHIDSVTIDQQALGSLIVDAANITFHYDGSPATPAQLTGNAVEPRNIGVGAGTSMIIHVDGSVFTFNSSELNNLVGSETADDLANMIDTKIGTAGTATVDNDRIVITCASTGSASSVEVAFTGSGAILVAPIFGFDINGQSAAGSDGVASAITVSNGDSTEDATFNITDPSATTFTTGNDAKFGGLTISLGSGSTLADLVADTEAVNIAVEEAEEEEMVGIVSIASVENAIGIVSAERSKLGAYQNRLEHSVNNLNVAAENLTAAESRLRDADMAKEMMRLTKNSILTQAAQAMLAHANLTPQGILQLLR